MPKEGKFFMEKVLNSRLRHSLNQGEFGSIKGGGFRGDLYGKINGLGGGEEISEWKVSKNFEDGLRNDSLDRSRSREGTGGLSEVLKVDKVVPDSIEKVVGGIERVVGRKGRNFLRNRLTQENVILWFFVKNFRSSLKRALRRNFRKNGILCRMIIIRSMWGRWMGAGAGRTGTLVGKLTVGTGRGRNRGPGRGLGPKALMRLAG
jgi:hypothetical protein